MNTPFLYAAALFAAFTAAAHVFVGGPKNARPVLTAHGVATGPRATVEFAWHAASVFLVFVAIAYLLAALGLAGAPLVWITTAHCGVLAILSAATALRAGISPAAFPPAPLFLLIALSGVAALWP